MRNQSGEAENDWLWEESAEIQGKAFGRIIQNLGSRWIDEQFVFIKQQANHSKISRSLIELIADDKFLLGILCHQEQLIDYCLKNISVKKLMNFPRFPQILQFSFRDLIMFSLSKSAWLFPVAFVP
jgi:hypothetical protein